MNKDTLHVVMSDMHSGSIHALTLKGGWQGQKTARQFPTSEQEKIRGVYETYISRVREARKGMRVRLVLDGDLIDGDHHASGDVFTRNPLEMSDVCVSLVNEFMKGINWTRGDELYLTKGTEVHTGDFENYIGKELNAIQNGDLYVYDLLQLETNGVRAWFVHHGPGAGEGANEGNALRNWMKNLYINCLKDGDKPPHIIHTGHVHKPAYEVLTMRNNMDFDEMRGIILPSWQQKTRYAWMKAPVSKNRIGGIYQVITADGMVGKPVFCAI